MIVHDNAKYQTLIEQINEVSYEIQEDSVLLEMIKQLESAADETQDPILKAVALYHKSDIPFKYHDLVACKTYITESLQFCKETNLTYYLLRCYNSLAIIDSEYADFYSSIGNYLKALSIADMHPEYRYGCVLLNNIGNLFGWLGEHEAALDYLIQGYHRYFEENHDSEYILGMLILNITEEYSLLNQYAKAYEWAGKSTCSIKDVSDSINMLLILNKIDVLYQEKDTNTVKILVGTVLSQTNELNNFIYVFRSYIRLFNYAIRETDKETADSVLERLENMSKDSLIVTFRYDYTVAKYHYYEAFQARTDNGSIAKNLIKEYVDNSSNVVNQLRNTYSHRLNTETQLLKVTHEKEEALNRSIQLQKDIQLDYFTGILNKISLEIYIDEAISAKEPDINQAMLLIDIDYFKHVNDTYGHERGDELLLAVVDTISSVCSKNMLFGRFGGDEFILFIDNAKQARFFTLFAEELLDKARRIEIDKSSHITFSIGIVIVESGDCFKEIFPKADTALYEAKRNGRDGYSVYQ